MDAEYEVAKEMRRLRAVIRELERRLSEGRHYLMAVSNEEITVEDALEAFGWTRDGVSEKE